MKTPLTHLTLAETASGLRSKDFSSVQVTEARLGLFASEGYFAAPPDKLYAKVTVEIIGQCRGPKILVFKKRTKKAYKKLQGHRQNYTDILIKTISVN